MSHMRKRFLITIDINDQDTYTIYNGPKYGTISYDWEFQDTNTFNEELVDGDMEDSSVPRWKRIF